MLLRGKFTGTPLRAIAIALFSAIALVAPHAGISPRATAAEEPLPADLTLIVPGGGWGHGHGMSQYGARAQAEDGRTWRQILGSYYTGVSIVNRGATTVRVLVGASSAMVVGGPEAYRAYWVGGSTIAHRTDSAPYMRVSPTASGLLIEKGPSPSGPWTRVAERSGRIRFNPDGPIMPVYAGGAIRYYRGVVDAYRRSSSTVYTINRLSMEHYLYGVVPRESPSSWHREALRAQAVAARSYTAWKKANGGNASYDICATTACQVYGGYGSRPSPSSAIVVLERSSTNAAVDATAGQTIVSGGHAIFAEYHSSSGGHTAQGSRPYLAPVPDPWDRTYSPHYRWSARITVADVERQWPTIGRLARFTAIGRDGDGPWGGRVESLTLVGTDGTKTISGNQFRSAFSWSPSGRPKGVRSTLFRISIYDAELVAQPTEVLLGPGETGTATVRLRNTGTVSWPVGSRVRLGTWGPKNRRSAFEAQSWNAPTRPTYISSNVTNPTATSVAPDEIAEFRFDVTAPETMSSGLYEEQFRPLASNLTWFAEPVTVPIRIRLFGAAHLGANVVQNPSFEAATGSQPAGWDPYKASSGDARDPDAGLDGHAALVLIGDRDIRKTYRQSITTGGKKGEAFVLSAWNRSRSISKTGSTIDAMVKLRNTDGTTTTIKMEFPKTAHGWTYRETEFEALKDFRRIDVYLHLRYQTGKAWYDRVRLARNDTPNASFETGSTVPTGWRTSGSGVTVDKSVAYAGRRSLRVRGSGTETRYAWRRLPLAGAKGDMFRVAGWNRTVGSRRGGGAVWISARVVHSDGTTVKHRVDFPRDPHRWGYGEILFETSKAYRRVDIFTTYSRQAGTGWFDEITVARARGPRSLTGNSGFELGDAQPTGWTVINASRSLLSKIDAAAGDASLHLRGAAARNVYARQYVPLAGGAGDRYVLSGWNRTLGSDPQGGWVRIWARVRHVDGTTDRLIIEFSRAPHPWRFGELAFETKKPYVRIDVFAKYAHQTGDAWFDSVRLEPAVR